MALSNAMELLCWLSACYGPFPINIHEKGYQGNRDRKRGFGVRATEQTTERRHTVANIAHPSPTFHVVNRRPLLAPG